MRLAPVTHAVTHAVTHSSRRTGTAGTPGVGAVVVVLLLIAGTFVATPPRAALAQESGGVVPAPPVEVADTDARQRVAAFDKAVKAARRETLAFARRQGEIEALVALAGGTHDRIARRLADAAADDDLLADTRVAALGALVLQGPRGSEQTGRVEKWLAREADADAEALARNDIGLPIDRRSGDALTSTPEAKQALLASESRARVLASGLRTLRALEHVPRRPEEILRPWLESPHDELAVAAVEAAQAWDARELATELALLLRMYPRANRWETGAVTHIAGTNASAKAAWMRLFGHPLKQRARPTLHAAVVACLSAWAGTAIADPDTCDAWLATLRRD